MKYEIHAYAREHYPQLDALMTDKQIAYAVLLDPDKDTYRAYNVQSMPTLVVVDGDGKQRFNESGYHSLSSLKRVVDGVR